MTPFKWSLNIAEDEDPATKSGNPHILEIDLGLSMAHLATLTLIFEAAARNKTDSRFPELSNMLGPAFAALVPESGTGSLPMRIRRDLPNSCVGDGYEAQWLYKAGWRLVITIRDRKVAAQLAALLCTTIRRAYEFLRVREPYRSDLTNYIWEHVYIGDQYFDDKLGQALLTASTKTVVNYV